MHVPRHIRPFPNENDEYSTIRNGNSSKMNGDIDMIVPDRILVAGGKAIIGEKQPPPEIALDLHTLPPVRNFQRVLETPPAKLTLQERSFPTVVDDVISGISPGFTIQRRNSIGSGDTKLESKAADFRRITERQLDGLSSSTLSLLTPGEELVLLRNHVRKLTSRVQKLEEDVQSLNTQVGWIEGLTGVLVFVFVLKKLKGIFFDGNA